MFGERVFLTVRKTLSQVADMVLSRKKLKRKLRAQGTSVPDKQSRKRKHHTASTLTQSSSKEADDQDIYFHAEADESHVIAIDENEVETYHNCIGKVLRGESGHNKAAKGCPAASTENAGKDEKICSSESLDYDAVVVHNAEHGERIFCPHRVTDSKSTFRELKGKKRKKDGFTPREDSPSKKLQEEIKHHPSLGFTAENELMKPINIHQSMKAHDSLDSRTVYVGGIPYYSSEDDIRSFFRDCGTISTVALKTFPDSGKFRGIAFLTFKTEGAAHRALAMDGASMGSCFLKIVPYSSKSTKDVIRIKVTHNNPPEKTEGYTRAYIGNLSWDITEQDIRTFFKNCKIDSIRFSSDKTTGEFQGFGHVDFADDESLEQALQLDQQSVLGRPIKIAYAVQRKRNEKETGKSTTKFKGKEKTCFTCGEKGHLSSHCRIPKK